MAGTARDVMQRHVISVDPDMPLVDVQRLFVEEEISGAPVVDETGRVVGVISSRDLLRAIDDERDTVAAEAHYHREDMVFSGPDWAGDTEDFQDRLAERCVGDVMTRGSVTVDVDSSVAEVARTMGKLRIHRVLVTDQEVLTGIVTSLDLVALLASDSSSEAA